MIGEHPQLYGLPELNLFCADDVRGVFVLAQEKAHKRHGLLRAIAQLEFGEQTEDSVMKAYNWLRERARWPSEKMEQYILEKVAPLRCVDKSPFYWPLEMLRRIHQCFPDAQFLHVGRHPRGLGSSLRKLLEERRERGQPDIQNAASRFEMYWQRSHESILIFREGLPADRYLFVEGERLLSEPDPELRKIAEWLGIDSEPAAIDAMKHPETSPYALPGPTRARLGNNEGFLHSPQLRQTSYPTWELDGPVDWLPAESGFSEQTKDIARRLGYA